MGNPYHDTEGKFTSKEDARHAWGVAEQNALQAGNLDDFLKARETQDLLGLRDKQVISIDDDSEEDEKEEYFENWAPEYNVPLADGSTITLPADGEYTDEAFKVFTQGQCGAYAVAKARKMGSEELLIVVGEEFMQEDIPLHVLAIDPDDEDNAIDIYGDSTISELQFLIDDGQVPLEGIISSRYDYRLERVSIKEFQEEWEAYLPKQDYEFASIWIENETY